MPFQIRDAPSRRPVAPTTPEPPQTITLRTMRSVHGPVGHFAHRGRQAGRADQGQVARRPRGAALLPFMRLAENGRPTARSVPAARCAHFTGIGELVLHRRQAHRVVQAGLFPRHAKGTDLDLPIRGTGAVRLARRPAAVGQPARDRSQEGLRRCRGTTRRRAAGARRPGTFSFGAAAALAAARAPAAARAQARQARPRRTWRGSRCSAATADLRGQEVLSWIERVVRGTRRRAPRNAAPANERSARRPTPTAPSSSPCSTTGAGAARSGGTPTATATTTSSPAVALMDAWWPRLVRGDLPARARAGRSSRRSPTVNVLDARPNKHFFFDGWWGYVQKDLRTILKRKVRGPLLARATAAAGR